MITKKQTQKNCTPSGPAPPSISASSSEDEERTRLSSRVLDVKSRLLSLASPASSTQKSTKERQLFTDTEPTLFSLRDDLPTLLFPVKWLHWGVAGRHLRSSPHFCSLALETSAQTPAPCLYPLPPWELNGSEPDIT